MQRPNKPSDPVAVFRESVGANSLHWKSRRSDRHRLDAAAANARATPDDASRGMICHRGLRRANVRACVRAEPWRDLPGEPLCVELDKEAGGGVGLSLAGNRDRHALGVFVAGLRPGGAPAAADGRVRVGDQLLQVCVRVC